MKDALLLKTTDGRALTIQEYLDANQGKGGKQGLLCV